MDSEQILEPQTLERIDRVYHWLTCSYRRQEIVRMGCDMWQVQPRMVDFYIQKAKLLIIENAKESQQDALEKAITRLETLYKECMRNDDRKTAALAAKQLSDLQGLNKSKIDVTTNGESINKFIVEIIYPKTDDGAGQTKPINP